MGKYVIETEVVRTYQYVFDADTDSDADQEYDNYVLNDKDLMHSEVSSTSLTKLRDSTGAYL